MFNQATLAGNLGNEPEVHTFDNGDKVAKFSLATNESYKKKDGERVTNTTWHNVVIKGNLAKIAEDYVKKGDPVLIQGKITNRSYESNGDTKYITEIVVDNFGGVLKMLGSKNENSSAASAPASAPSEDAGSPAETDDLPFG